MSKYMMYVGCYTNETENGIHIFQVDENSGKLSESGTVEISNSSYIHKSHTLPVLYSVTDFGVASFVINPDGSLKYLNSLQTKSMRGCSIDTDKEDKFLFVGGYHDGKLTMISLKEDGSLNEVVDFKHHKNSGNGTDRLSMGHVCCVKVTPDDKYVCAVDSGLEQVKIYQIDRESNEMILIDILRSELSFDPVKLEFSNDGKTAYLLSERKKQINIYKYEDENGFPKFTLIQKITAVGAYHNTTSSACSVKTDKSGKFLAVSIDGDNTVSLFGIENEGTLVPYCVLPISGKYPKDVIMSFDSNYLYSINHDENTITVFTINHESELFTMCAKPVNIESPNSAVIIDLDYEFKG